MLKVEEFILDNKDNWLELLQQPPYNLILSEDEDYALLKYNQLESDFDEPLVSECRGIIIDKHTLTTSALSFVKFWNVQEERHANIDWKSAKVLEKIDGSKILVFWNIYKNNWQVCTSGTLNAYEAVVNGTNYTYGDLFDEAIYGMDFTDLSNFFDMLDKDYCYTFELVSPKARIVVPYNKTTIYLIGVRNIHSFVEDRPNVHPISKIIKTPKEYSLKTLDDCLKATEKMKFNEEGFVVVDSNWNRVKIKSPAYVSVHYLRLNGNIGYARILDLLERKQENLLLQYYPEYQEKFNEVRLAQNNLNSELFEALHDITDMNESQDRKTIAEYINNNYSKFSGFLFKFLNTNLYKLFIETEWNKLPKVKKLKLLGFKEELDADEFKEE